MNNKPSKLKYFAVFGLFFIILAAGVALVFLFDKPKEKLHSGNVIAIVDGKNVYESDIEERLEFLRATTGNSNLQLSNLSQDIIKAMVLENVIDEKIIKKAKKVGLDEDEQILEFLNGQKEILMRQKYMRDYIFKKADEKAVLEKYEAIKNNLEGKEERKIRHILVKTEDEAERIRRNISRGNDFDKIAKKRSLDKISAPNGGDLGYLLKEELDPDFANVAFILKKNELSKPIQSQFGWHIIQVQDIREAKVADFDDVKDDIKSALEQELMQNFLLEETKDIKIEIKDVGIKPTIDYSKEAEAVDNENILDEEK